MIAKEEKQLIRYAIRNRWLSAEEGEDVLFLRKKFGTKYSIAELIRQRQYLDDEELEALFAAVGSDFEKRQQRTGIFRLASITGAKGASPQAAVRTTTNRRAPPVRGKLRAQAAPKPAQGAQRRVRRKLNALSAPPPPRKADATDSHVGTRPELPDRTIAMQPVAPPDLEDTAAPERTVVDMNAMAELQALRSEFNAEVVSPGPEAVPAYEAEGPSTEYYLDSGNTFDSVDASEHTVVGFPGMLEALAGEGEATDEHRVSGEEAQGATLALSADDLALLHESKAPLEQRFVETPLYAEPDIGATEEVAPAPLERTRSERRAELHRNTPVVEVEEFRPSIPVPEAAGEAPIVRSRSDLKAALQDAVRDSEELQPGDMFGRYEIVRCVARGTSSIVYLGQALDDGQEFAIKILKSEMSYDPDFVSQFLHDSEMLMNLSSPHLVNVYEVGQFENSYFTVLQYVDGWSLEERLETPDPVDYSEALQITRAIAHGLDSFSKHGLVHRDIKPANILIGRNGSVLLTDFGFAQALRPVDVRAIGATGRIVGTPAYMSPEQIMGQPLDIRSDFYSLGATLYRLLTGHEVYPGSSVLSVVTKHVSREVPKLSEINQHAPPLLSELISQMLAKSPAQRFQTSAQLILALDKVEESLTPGRRVQTSLGPDVLDYKRVYKQTALWGSLGLGFCLVLGLLSNQFLANAVERSNFVFKLSMVATSSLLMAMLLFTGLGLIRRGELPLPSASAWFLKLKDITGAIGGGCLWLSAMVGAPSAIRIFAGILGLITWGTLIYGVVLRRDIARIRFDGVTSRTLAILGDARMVSWRRVHALMLATVVGVSSVKFALLKYFQSSGL